MHSRITTVTHASCKFGLRLAGIGGLAVSRSYCPTGYFIQIAICLVASALVKSLTTRRPVVAVIMCVTDVAPPLCLRSQVNVWRAKLTSLRFYSTLILVEFQGVQGFFIAAIQIATLATFQTGSGPSSPSLDSISSISWAVRKTQMVQTWPWAVSYLFCWCRRYRSAAACAHGTR